MKKFEATEAIRYFSVRHLGLISIHTDGRVLRKTPFISDWALYAKKKREVSLDEWLAKKHEFVRGLPGWQRDCHSIPTIEMLSRWSIDGVAETPTGYMVEPDGVAPDGSPSWLSIFAIL